MQTGGAQLKPDVVLKERNYCTKGEKAKIHRIEWVHNGDLNVIATSTALANKGTPYNHNCSSSLIPT